MEEAPIENNPPAMMPSRPLPSRPSTAPSERANKSVKVVHYIDGEKMEGQAARSMREMRSEADRTAKKTDEIHKRIAEDGKLLATIEIETKAVRRQYHTVCLQLGAKRDREELLRRKLRESKATMKSAVCFQGKQVLDNQRSRTRALKAMAKAALETGRGFTAGRESTFYQFRRPRQTAPTVRPTSRLLPAMDTMELKNLFPAT